MAVNQKQIAERVGLSISLVSRVLSGNARDIGIAESTIERVRSVADELGYVPNVAAQTLKGKASNTIGVVVYDFQDPFFGSTIERLQSIAHENGHSLVLTGFQGRHPAASDLAPLHKHVIDGLVIIGSAERSAWLDGFTHLPVTRVGHGEPEEKSVRVAIDEEDAARQLLEHLASRGLSRCTYLGSDLFVHHIRYQAFARAAKALGIGIDQVIESQHGFRAGYHAARELSATSSQSAALICATDRIAMGALHALHDAGQQRAVTGFDDIPGAAEFIPSITTIRQPIDEMVQRAFSLSIRPEGNTEILLKGKLIVRSST